MLNALDMHRPIMGNLSQVQIERAKPFQKSGVNLAGPFLIKASLKYLPLKHMQVYGCYQGDSYRTRRRFDNAVVFNRVKNIL